MMPKRRRAMSTLSVDRGGQTIGALAYPNVSFPPDERDRGEYLVQDIFVCWQTRISNQLAILTRNNWHSIGILLCASFPQRPPSTEISAGYFFSYSKIGSSAKQSLSGNSEGSKALLCLSNYRIT